MFGIPIPISVGGYWLGGHRVSSPRAIWHPGAGGSLGWADPDQKLAVAVCHNRMFNARDPKDDPILPISKAVVAALGLEWKSRSEEHTSAFQSLMRISYAVCCLKIKQTNYR